MEIDHKLVSKGRNDLFITSMVVLWMAVTISNYINSGGGQQDILRYNFINLLLFIVIIIVSLVKVKVKVNRTSLYLLLGLALSVSISYFVNGSKGGLFAIPLIIFGYAAMYLILPKFKFPKYIYNCVFTFGLGYSVFPVLNYIIFNDLSMIAYDGTFKGFAGHRNAYGFLAGLTILMIISHKKRNVLYLIVPIIGYGLMLAQSRSTIIATMIGILIMSGLSLRSWTNRAKIATAIIGFSYLYILAMDYWTLFNISNSSTFSMARNMVSADNGRIEHLDHFYKFIQANLFWGYGGAYTVWGSPAHNVIIQETANYGLISVILFLVLYYLNMSQYSSDGKAYFAYLLVLGMFQPALGIGINWLIALVVITALSSQRWDPEKV